MRAGAGALTSVAEGASGLLAVAELVEVSDPLVMGEDELPVGLARSEGLSALASDRALRLC
jgi:hypothetical protein